MALSQAGAAFDRRSSGKRDATGKIRIGFVSHHFRAHTISQLMSGLIAEFSREKFSVTILSIGDHKEEFAESIEANSVHGSDAAETAANEIRFFFRDLDIVG